MLFLWMTVAFSDAGSHSCEINGHEIVVDWTTAGDIVVSNNGVELATGSVGSMSGNTIAVCRDNTLRLTTDTGELVGKLTLNTATIDLSEVAVNLPEVVEPEPEPVVVEPVVKAKPCKRRRKRCR